MLAPAEVHAVRCDVTQIDEVEALGRDADRLLGGVDLMVNNAGVAVGGRMEEIPLADWEWILGVNLRGVVHGCHVFLPRLRAQKKGAILNVASSAGLISAPMLSPYNATKAAVVALSESLFAEVHTEGIGISVLCPTFFETGILDASRTTGQDDTIGLARTLMAQASIQADEVAQIALEGVSRGRLYILPHPDGRWMWRLKRFFPEGFARLVPRALEMRARVSTRASRAG